VENGVARFLEIPGGPVMPYNVMGSWAMISSARAWIGPGFVSRGTNAFVTPIPMVLRVRKASSSMRLLKEYTVSPDSILCVLALRWASIDAIAMLHVLGQGRSLLDAPRTDPGVQNCRVAQPLLAFAPTDPGGGVTAPGSSET
jgi:hypothetical protein